ncbi:dynamin family protein [Rhodobacter sp. NSM]|uniref:dynamin family protein n=1 Tax=Rhodobacter sp. NSM TaxID=3457501 RepID=UPI003FD245C7
MNLPLELSQIVGEAADVSPAIAARPRIMIAGEFSSGKTCLVNALLGEAILPSSVTSTSLPPIWISHGEGAPECVGIDGHVQAFESVPEMVAHVLATDLVRIHHCRIQLPNPLLLDFDLIDTPGSSDPNIPSTSWERMVAEADMIVWCSPAVQAWRQSEKSIWLSLPEAVTGPSLLVLSQADKLANEEDRAKVMGRVLREADGLFASVCMSSFLSDTDVRKLRSLLRDSALILPRRTPRPILPPGEAPADTAAHKVVPRRIRGSAATSGPLLLVTRAASESDVAPEQEEPAPLPPDEAEANAPDLAVEAIEAEQPDAVAEAPEADPADDLDLSDMLASIGDAAAFDPVPEPVEPEAESDFLALLRGAIEAGAEHGSDEATEGSRHGDEDGVLDIEEASEDEPAAINTAHLSHQEVTLTRETLAAVPLRTATSSAGPAADAATDQPREAAAEAAPVMRDTEPVTARRASRPAAPAMMFGPARMLWEQILPTLDADDPDSLLDGIDQLVAELDLTWARACLQSAPPSGRRRGGPA